VIDDIELPYLELLPRPIVVLPTLLIDIERNMVPHLLIPIGMEMDMTMRKEQTEDDLEPRSRQEWCEE
jgi:hypothetical protein